MTTTSTWSVGTRNSSSLRAAPTALHKPAKPAPTTTMRFMPFSMRGMLLTSEESVYQQRKFECT